MAHLDLKTYRNLAPKHASLFGQPWWLDALCPNAWDAVVHEGKKGLILWPFHFKKRMGFKAVLMPEVSLFGGPFVSGETTNEDWKAVSNILFKFDKMVYQSHFRTELDYFESFSDFSISNRTHYELKQSEEPRLLYNKNTLRKLKNKKGEVEIVQTTSLENFLRLSKESYRNQGVKTPYRDETLNRLNAAVNQHDSGFILEAHTPRGVQAAIWITYDSSTAYYFLSGVDRELPEYGGVVKLVDFAIHWAFSNHKEFNFYGSEVPGVARFMQGFGAQPCTSYLITHQRNSILKLLEKYS